MRFGGSMRQSLVRIYLTIFSILFFGILPKALAAPVISVSANSVAPNSLISMQLNDGYGFAYDWIGLYEVGAGDKYFINRVYIPKGQKFFIWNLTLPREGNFEFRYYLKNSFVRAATSPSIISEISIAPSLNLSKVSIDGLDTYYQAPKLASGVLFFFHGHGGSAASFSSQVEAIYFANAALARGYYVVFLESSDRVKKAWDPSSSLSSNRDLVHIQNVRNYLRNTLGISNQLPEYALGMSNGGGFAPLASYYFKFRAVAVYCASGYSTLFQQSNYSIPVFFMAAENDSIVDRKSIEANLNLLKEKNIPVQFELNLEKPLLIDRFRRINGITSSESKQIFSNLVQSGYINSSGIFLRSPSGLTSLEAGIQFFNEYQAIKDQLLAVYAEHQFTSEFSAKTLDFLGRH